MGFLKQAIKFSWEYFLTFTVISIVLILLSNYGSIFVTDNLRGALLSGKIAVVSITLATMTFFYRMFWDSIGLLKDNNGLNEVVNYFSKGVVLLFGGGLFVSYP